MNQKRRSVDLQTFVRAFEYGGKRDMRFGQLLVNALTAMKARSRNDFELILWNIENEDLERELNLFIDTHS